MVKNLKRNILRLSILIVLGALVLAGTISVAALTQTVYVKNGNDTITLHSIKTDTHQLLHQAGVYLGPDDSTRRTDTDSSITIEVLRAFPVKITDDNETREVYISTGTVLDAVEKSGLTLDGDDIISPDASNEVAPGMEITISRRHNISLTIGKDTKSVVVPSGTVRSALEFLKLPLGPEDSVDVDPETQVHNEMSINLVRVEYIERKEKEEIPYSKATSVTDSLYEGEKRVEEGKNGVREVTIQDKVVNGEVVEIKRISEEILVEPQKEITYLGIKGRTTSSSSGSISKGKAKNNGNGTFTDHDGNTVEYKSVMSGSATAYTAAEGARTSTGKVAQHGYVAVDPKKIPYGTKLYITSSDGSFVYGYAVAADTGGAMLSGSKLVDLYYNSVSECYQFGIRNVNVYIL